MNQSIKMLERKEGGVDIKNGNEISSELDAVQLDCLIDAAIFRWVSEHPGKLDPNKDGDSIRKLFGRSKVIYL